MNDPNRLLKWLLVIGLVALGLVILYPPSEKLKGGIDLVGGTSLLFEVDTTGLSAQDQRGLSTRVMNILKERVDPKGQLNLEWRPVGRTRIEIRMPRPPQEALARRQAYNDVIDQINRMNLTRFEVESALNATGQEREASIRGLSRGVEHRRPLVEAAVTAFDAYRLAQEAGDIQAAGTAQTGYEEAIQALLNTSVPVSRFTDVLGLASKERREEELTRLRREYPAYDAGGESEPQGKLMTKAVVAYDAWAQRKAELEDPSDLKRRLRGAGVLEFRILADRDPNQPEMTRDERNAQVRQPISRYVAQLQQYGPRPKSGDRFVWFPVEDVLDFMHLDKIDQFEEQQTSPTQPIVERYAGDYYALVHDDPEYKLVRGTGARRWSLLGAYPDRDPMTGRNIVLFSLDPRGGQLFGELTGNNLQRSLCIMLDDKAMSHAVIQSRITQRGQITGNFTQERVLNLVRILEAGSLPARLKETPLMENTVGPSLGETNRMKGLRAAIWGTIAVVVFMLIYYGFAGGGVADIALALNALFVLAIMALLQATFTLPGIAGLVLTVGMAVDANVLIFERIREERERGVVFRKALNAGYDRAFSAIFDSNLTTLITCVILGYLGSEEVKGFAITLGIGLATSMFTALTVTRLILNTLNAKGWLHDLTLRQMFKTPEFDWVALRRVFWPISLVVTVGGTALFIGLCVYRTESMFDIEFLGGTAIQIDLKPDRVMTDEEVRQAVSSDEEGAESAVRWLRRTGDQLLAATAAEGELAGQFTLTSSELTAEHIGVLMRGTIENKVERGGIRGMGRTAVFDGKPGALTLASFREAVEEASRSAHRAADRLTNARVQSVGELNPTAGKGLSYEISSIESNRELVQAAVLDTLGERLSVQLAITFTTVMDEEMTQEPFFVVEQSDQYLSDVIGGGAHFDIRRFRGGVAVVAVLDPTENPLTQEVVSRRLREVGLQPEFEQFQSRGWAIFPLDTPTALPGGAAGYRQFAILTADESLRYDDDAVQWTESLARSHLAQVEAALGQEKSLSRVIQFAAPIARQTQNRAMFAIVLSLAAIVAYLWLRFGTKEFGLASTMATVHDVAVMLGCIALSHVVAGTAVGRALMIEPFRVDMTMLAAILTVIGYSLNDTIVIFDRIRENRGRVESLNPKVLNLSINQTLSRTVLTALTVFLVVFTLYVFGGAGVHGFAFALLIGVVEGTYSTVAVAAPLLHRVRLLHGVVIVLITLTVIGILAVVISEPAWRLVLMGLAAVIGLVVLIRQTRGSAGYLPNGQPAGA